MKIDMEIISTELLKPSSPTPLYLKSFKRSFLDQIAPAVYVPINLFYMNDADHGLNTHKILLRLKNSLSKTLARFYPFAGRIKDNVSIDCNDEGVIYKEAKAPCQLSEFLEKPDIDVLRKFVPCKPWEVKIQPPSLPLLGVQVNVFECGGIVIGCCFSHLIADARTISLFLNSWANTARQCGEKMSSPDLTTASRLFPPRDPLPDGMSYRFSPEGRKFLTKRFVFDAKSIAGLKTKVSSNTNPNPSRVQSVTAFMWERYMSRSRILSDAASSKVSNIAHSVNLRPRANPPLPSCSVGNLFTVAIAQYDPLIPSQESLQEGKLLPVLAEKLKEGLDSVNSHAIGSLQRDQGFETMKTGIEDEQESADEKEKIYDIGWSSWCNMGFYEIDFGWGKPIWFGGVGKVEEPNVQKQNICLLLDSEPGTDSGVDAWTTLPEEQMAILENDPEFLKFASLNPSIRRR